MLVTVATEEGKSSQIEVSEIWAGDGGGAGDGAVLLFAYIPARTYSIVVLL